jgi:hypothetical protein
VRRALVLAAVLAAAVPAAAQASFPYAPKLPPGANKGPNDLTDKRVWMYAATPESGNQPVNSQSSELNGVRGAHLVDNADVDTAWRTTTGRPDVTIAVLDSGIKWNDAEAMKDLRLKVRLNRGELPKPGHDRSSPLDGTKPCSGYADDWDANGDGVFNVADYACDSRVERDPAARAARGQPRGVGPADVLEPQDVLIAFSDGSDADHNGFADDIAGWDFLDDDNDPFDDVQYGHGTGEARDSNAEADNGGDLGTCPNCTVVPLRVGDSFVADENRFAQAVLYAVDNRVLVIQEALGTIDHTRLATEAIDRAYRRGVTVIASAADEAAQHHNWPSNEPHVVVVNSVTKYDETLTAVPKSYLQFNGCTNFSSKITIAIPSVSCSSDATGRASGMAGLIYSAALDRGLRLSANEVKQLLATTADDVNFASAELSCEPVPTDACTDPNLNSVNPFRLVAPFPATLRYPARKGYDEFYGYGRVNMNTAVDAVSAGRVPPEASIDSPDWYAFVDPAKPSLDVRGHVGARSGSYRCVLEAAPGSQPNNASDFEPVGGGWCDGSARSGSHDGALGSVDVAALKKRFPAGANDFTGPEPGSGAGQTSNGRPNSEPYGFTLRVRVTQGSLTGEDRRNLYLHRDKDLLPGFPLSLTSDGEASPAFADLDGDNRNELVVATADGTVHAYKPDGSEAPGWPVAGDSLSLHTGGSYRGAFLASPAAADLDRDGSPEVVAADFEGRVYAWDAHGHRLWTRRTKAEYSGMPLSPFVDVRKGKRNRTQRGFIGSPVAADLDKDGKLEVVAAAMDRHVYAWHADGGAVGSFPALVVDRSKVASIDPTTHAVSFNANAGDELDQGAIIDTPAVGDLTGDGRPEIVVGTNEEYSTDAPGEGGLNAGGFDAGVLGPLAGAAGLDTANGRLYVLKPDGSEAPGWPVKIARLSAELLPVVGEGITGAPAIGPAECGDGRPVVGAIPDAGLGYLLNADGSSCLGESGGKPRVLATTPPGNVNQDLPAFPAVGHPAFGDFAGGISMLAPAAGLRRALDLAVNEYQQGSQDFVGAWDTSGGGFLPGFPAVVNDLQFITGPSVADIDGKPGEEALEGTASLDLAAFDGNGRPPGPSWPKLTSDWMVANPLIGSFGDIDHKVVVAATRSGRILAYRTTAPACSPGSWPRFHHDNANSGDFDRDAVAPGKPTELSVSGDSLSFTGVGDDLLCGTPARYEVLSGGEVTRSDAKPGAAGARQSVLLPAGHGRRVGLRAVDDAGNLGPLASVDTSR